MADAALLPSIYFDLEKVRLGQNPIDLSASIYNKSFDDHHLKVGSVVWLTDNDLMYKATIKQSDENGRFAHLHWGEGRECIVNGHEEDGKSAAR